MEHFVQQGLQHFSGLQVAHVNQFDSKIWLRTMEFDCG